ncbi:MAG: hypothetical protein ACTHU0_21555 [Kofleriaceae bacterium]
MIRRLLAVAARRLPSRRVITGADGSPYLSRWTLLDIGWRWPRVYLHRFHRSDEDPELHNHPWRWAVGLILAGGYREERRGEGGRVEVRDVGPGAVNVIHGDTFHRVELLDGECWTLFLTGSRTKEWGFWCRATGAFTPWREFIRAKGLVPFDARRPAEGAR